MRLIEIFLTAVGLAMDAFSVSICKGLSMKRLNYVNALIIALFFGVFQAVMPLIGFLIVKTFDNTEEFQYFISNNSGLIAFVLLAFIGGKMIWDACKDKKQEVKKTDKSLNYTELLFLAIATSIDALMTGFAYAVMQIDMVLTVTIIGVVTFVLSFIGVFIGHFFGSKWEKPASIAGGIILILLGIKFLLDFLGII